MTKFWMVWKVDGCWSKVRHETLESAIAEARRLSLIEKNQYDSFCILEAHSDCFGPKNTGPRPVPAKIPAPTPLTPEQRAERDKAKAARRADKRDTYEGRTGKKATSGEARLTTLSAIRRTQKVS